MVSLKLCTTHRPKPLAPSAPCTPSNSTRVESERSEQSVMDDLLTLNFIGALFLDDCMEINLLHQFTMLPLQHHSRASRAERAVGEGRLAYIAIILSTFTRRLHGVKFHQLSMYIAFIVAIDQVLAWRLVSRTRRDPRRHGHETTVIAFMEKTYVVINQALAWRKLHGVNCHK